MIKEISIRTVTETGQSQIRFFKGRTAAQQATEFTLNMYFNGNWNENNGGNKKDERVKENLV